MMAGFSGTPAEPTGVGVLPDSVLLRVMDQPPLPALLTARMRNW